MTDQTSEALVAPEATQAPLTHEGDVRGPRKAPANPRTMPKWESEARNRIRTAIRRYGKPLSDLIARDANEGDTRLLVTDFLCEGLGYDKYEDLTTEYQVKGEFADYGIRVDKQLAAFIKVKRCTQKLGVKHLRQVQMYAVNEGVEWMVLTNGQVWQVYHLTGGLPVVVDLALEIDLLDRVLLTPVILDAVRKELRRQTGHNADEKEIERILQAEVLRPDLLA